MMMYDLILKLPLKDIFCQILSL